MDVWTLGQAEPGKAACWTLILDCFAGPESTEDLSDIAE